MVGRTGVEYAFGPAIFEQPNSDYKVGHDAPRTDVLQ